MEDEKQFAFTSGYTPLVLHSTEGSREIVTLPSSFTRSDSVKGYLTGLHVRSHAGHSFSVEEKQSQPAASTWKIDGYYLRIEPGTAVNVNELYPGYIVRRAGQTIVPDEAGFIEAESGPVYELEDRLPLSARSRVAAYQSFTPGRSCAAATVYRHMMY